MIQETPLIQLYNDYRKELIDVHKFYMKQATNRLLKNFDNLSDDADEYEKQYIDQYSQTFDPEEIDEGTFYENAFQESTSFYLELVKLREQTQLLILTGMLHSWERRLRSFLINESRYWTKLFKTKEVKEFLEKNPIDAIFNFFDYLGWDVKNESFYDDLHALILLVNASKHGSGSSLKNLAAKYPKYIKKGYQSTCANGLPNILDDCYFELDEEIIEILSNSIVQFWTKFPETFYFSNINKSPSRNLKQLLI